MKSNPWYVHWFNEDYLKLYSYRDPREAAHHVSFLIKALKLQGNEKILDLGCGSGRHALAFAKKGYEVLGIDISEFLIDQAKQALNRNFSLKARFLACDMLHLEDVGVFDVVINMFTSFGYFESDHENAQVFRVAKERLGKGGKFFLDYLHPAQVARDLVPYEERQVNGEKVIIKKCIEDGRVIKTIAFPGRTYVEKVRLYDRDRIEKMLSKSGFTVVNVWNDYEGNPWGKMAAGSYFHAE